MSDDRWIFSRDGDRCGACSEPIPSGTPARKLQTGRLRCPACALRLFRETPPAKLLAAGPPAPPPPTPAPPTNGFRPLQPFVERARQRFADPAQRDFKQRAGGDPDHEHSSHNQRREPRQPRRHARA